MEERTQLLSGRCVEGGMDAMRTGGSLAQRRQSGLVEGMDRVAHGLIVATESVGDPRDTLVPRGGEEDLATTQGERRGGVQPGGQCVAFAVRQGTDKDWCWHGREHTTSLSPRL
jgi:hypothetical protein